MSVVNVRVSFLRPQYNNLKEWMDNPNHVYIGRGRIVVIDGQRYPTYDSLYCNPFKIGPDGDRDIVLTKYETYIKQKISKNELFLEPLKNKILGCWCHPESCHGDILLKLLTETK